MITGEEVYLDPEQGLDCRLFGCQHVGQQIIFTQVESARKAMFCPRHAEQIANNEIHLAGIAAKPVSVVQS